MGLQLIFTPNRSLTPFGFSDAITVPFQDYIEALWLYTLRTNFLAGVRLDFHRL